MDIASLIYELSNHNRTILLLLIYFGLLAVVYKSFTKKKKLNEYLKTFRWFVCGCLLILGHILLMLRYSNVIVIEGVCTWQFAVVNMVLDILIVVYLRFIPSRTERKLKRLNSGYGKNPLRLHLDLQKMNTFHMTPKELMLWNREYYTNLYVMGSVNKAVEIMEKVEPKDSVRSRMLYSLRSEALGNMEEARDKMLKAMDVIKPEDEKLRVQLYNNIARCNRFCENNDVAWIYYNKAADLIDSKTHRSVVHTVYSNLIIQGAIIERSDEEINQLLHQYKHQISNKRLEDIIEYDNTELTIARERNNVDKQKKLIEERYDFVYTELLKSDKKKAVAYNVSVLKMVHMLQMNPLKYMNAIQEEWTYIHEMPLPEKYYLMKELWSLLIEPPTVSDLFVERYKEIFSYVEFYIKNDAEADLERYISEISNEAVYAHGHTQQELVWLQKWKDNYDFEVIYRKMRSIIDLYNSQSLRLEAIIMAGNLIDELVAKPNINHDFSSKYPEILESELSKLALEMEHVKSHVGVADVYLRIAFGFVYLHDYKDADKYYHEFLKYKINRNHFSVWTKANLQFVEMVCKIWEIKRELIRIKKKSQTDISLSKESKEWLKKYPQISTEEMVILLATAMKRLYVSAKIVGWGQESSAGILIEHQHWWLLLGDDAPVNDFNCIIEVDLCYDQISELDSSDRIVFYPGMHPLEARNEQWVLDNVNNLPDYQVCLEWKTGRVADFIGNRFKPVHEIGERLRNVWI